MVAVIAYIIIYQMINHLIKDKELSSKLIKYLCYIVGVDLIAALLFNYMGEATLSASKYTSNEGDNDNSYIPSHLQHLQSTVKPEYIQPVPYQASSHVSPGSTVQIEQEQQSTLAATSDQATVPIPKLKAKQNQKPQPKPIQIDTLSLSEDSPYNINSLLNADTDSSSGSDIIPIYHSKPDTNTKNKNLQNSSSETNIPVYKSRK